MTDIQPQLDAHIPREPEAPTAGNDLSEANRSTTTQDKPLSKEQAMLAIMNMFEITLDHQDEPAIRLAGSDGPFRSLYHRTAQALIGTRLRSLATPEQPVSPADIRCVEDSMADHAVRMGRRIEENDSVWERIEEDPLLQSISLHLEAQPLYVGLASELFQQLRRIQSLHRLSKRRRRFPPSPSWMGRRLEEQRDLLATVGISIVTTHTNEGTEYRISRDPRIESVLSDSNAVIPSTDTVTDNSRLHNELRAADSIDGNESPL